MGTDHLQDSYKIFPISDFSNWYINTVDIYIWYTKTDILRNIIYNGNIFTSEFKPAELNQ